MTLPFTAVQGCSYGTLRLVGGRSSNEGRVEICINGLWGTVCDGFWDNNDARVVCRQLGFPVGVSGSGIENMTTCFFNLHSLSCYLFLVTSALYGHQHNFGQGTGPIFLYGLGCTGTESSLLSCSHSGIRFNWCGHYSDAGVICPCRLDVYSCLLGVQGINDNYLLSLHSSNSLEYFKNRCRCLFTIK